MDGNYNAKGQVSHMNNKSFLQEFVILTIKQLRTLKEIDLTKKRGKLSLPNLKKKHEIISKMMEAFKVMIERSAIDDSTVNFSYWWADLGRDINHISVFEEPEEYEKVISKLLTVFVRGEPILETETDSESSNEED